MSPQICFFASIGFSLAAWGGVTARYIWPRLHLRKRSEALRALLTLHTFRFLGLAFLVPGVASSQLPPAFSHEAAFGDIIAAALAWLALISLRSGAGIAIVWVFNLWGSADLLNAFYQAGRSGLMPGQLGAAYFIPTVAVPLLLITHVLIFRILLQHESESVVRDSRLPA